MILKGAFGYSSLSLLGCSRWLSHLLFSRATRSWDLIFRIFIALVIMFGIGVEWGSYAGIQGIRKLGPGIGFLIIGTTIMSTSLYLGGGAIEKNIWPRSYFDIGRMRSGFCP